jgi:flavin reductase (DIM6/NTAB) family NADH-FMN oxidoreductase RutF
MSAPQVGVPAVISADAFRDVMATVCAPVTVVTTTTADGKPYGTTVSAFASLSLDPPLVMIALGNRSGLLAHARASGRIGVNLLSHDQQSVAGSFACSGGDKFAGVRWSWADRLPRIHGAVGWLVADVDQLVPGGDHTILLAAVRSAQTWAAPPLIYARRRFGTHTGLQADSASCVRAGRSRADDR